MFSSFEFYGILVFVNACVFVSICVSCVFFFGSFPCLVVLYYSYYYSAYVCLFSKERKRRCELRWKGKGEGTRKSRGVKTIIKIYCNKKNHFSIKEKIR